MTTLSYAHGPATIPLRGQTIGEALAATVAAHGDRDAVVSCHEGIRLTYRRVRGPCRARRAGAAGRGRANAATASASGRRTAPSGSSSSTRPPASARSSSTSTRRTASTSSTSCSASRASRCCCTRPGSRASPTGRWSRPPTLPGAARAIELGGPDWEAFLAGATGVDADRAGGARGRADVRPADQHPVHVGHHGPPQGRDALAPQHPQQRPLRRPRAAATTRPTASACRCRSTTASAWCWATSRPSRTAAASWSRPRRSTRAPSSRPSRPSAARRSTACRRCSSRCWPTRSCERFDVSSLRTGIMAGSPCPVEVMRRTRRDLHMDEVTICYGMTETSPVSTQTRRDDPVEKRVGSVGTVHAHVEVKVVDPETGRTVPRGEPGELCTRGYSVMLGYWDDEAATRGRHRRVAVDAHGRPGDDGRRRLREHRRPHQGPRHPRRREHLAPRGRGVPATRIRRSRTRRCSACRTSASARSWPRG